MVEARLVRRRHPGRQKSDLRRMTGRSPPWNDIKLPAFNTLCNFLETLT
jgi:hypothetical protein